MSVEALCVTPQTVALRESSKRWARTHKRLYKEFMTVLKAQAPLLTPEYRQELLNSLIAGFNSHPVVNTYHEYSHEQAQIDTILLDQRCRTGMKVLRLSQAIKATEIDDIPPHEVVDFLQDFVDQTAEEFSIPDEYLDRLRLCVGRAVYPVLFPFLWDFHVESNLESDATFESQQKWLRLLSPSDLDHVLSPFEQNLELFEKGVDILEGLCLQIVRIEYT